MVCQLTLVLEILVTGTSLHRLYYYCLVLQTIICLAFTITFVLVLVYNDITQAVIKYSFINMVDLTTSFMQLGSGYYYKSDGG